MSEKPTTVTVYDRVYYVSTLERSKAIALRDTLLVRFKNLGLLYAMVVDSIEPTLLALKIRATTMDTAERVLNFCEAFNIGWNACLFSAYQEKCAANK